MSTDHLTKFIHSHDNCLVLSHDDSRLFVRSLISVNGQAQFSDEWIAANLRSVLNWLGY